MEVVGAAGCQHPSELEPHHIIHRITEDKAVPADLAYELLTPGVLRDDAAATHFAADWQRAQADSFAPA
jgi:hypothetical protein